MYEKKEFEELLSIIKINPAIYLLKKDISYLEQFLYAFPEEFFRKNDQELFKFFKANIWKYIKDYLDAKSLKFKDDTVFWSKVIISISHNKNEAWDIFFEILDNFIKDYNDCSLDKTKVDNSMNKTEYSIKETITVIKKRWGMFLIENKIECLYHELLGLSFREYENNIYEKMNKYFVKYFHKFVIKYIEDNRLSKNFDTRTWCDSIKSVCQNDQEAMNLFFDIFDEFMNNFNSNISLV